MELINEDTKYKLFINKISNEKDFKKELNALFKIELKNSFKNILNTPKIDFLNKLTKDVYKILTDHYSSKIFENNTFEKLILFCSETYEKKYDKYLEYLSSQWKKYLHQKSHIMNDNSNSEKNLEHFYFKNFRKHCSKTGEYALHCCQKNKKLSKFIIVYKKEKLKYLICENCRRAYFIKEFKNFCEFCKIKYYSTYPNCNKEESLINDNKINIFLSTVYPTHCNLLFNKVMHCPKCKKHLYINIKTNELICLNRKCNFINKNPDSLDWKCSKCETKYITRAIIYNEVEILHFENLIKNAMILKELAHPQKTCCLTSENISSMQFYHNKKCHGILYLFKQSKTLFLLCDKCKAINFFRNFIWTCPICGLYYREINSVEIEEKLIKKYKLKEEKRESNFRKKGNLFDYIKNKKYCRSIEIYNERRMNESSDARNLKKDLSKKKFLMNSIEKIKIYKPKNISTDFSTSFLETNNDNNNNLRDNSQNKRSGLCRRILYGFIKPLEEKTWNSVDKRNVINISEVLQNEDELKLNKGFKKKHHLNINLLSNFDQCTTGREFQNNKEFIKDNLVISQLNTYDELELNNCIENKNNKKIENFIKTNENIENNNISQERSQNKIKNRMRLRKNLKMGNNKNGDNSKKNILNNISTNKFKNINKSVEKIQQVNNMNYSISTKVDLTTIKNNKNESKNKENLFKYNDNILNLKNNLAPSKKNQKYSALIIEEKENRKNNEEKNDLKNNEEKSDLKNNEEIKIIYNNKNVLNKLEKINKKKDKLKEGIIKTEENIKIEGNKNDKLKEGIIRTEENIKIEGNKKDETSENNKIKKSIWRKGRFINKDLDNKSNNNENKKEVKIKIVNENKNDIIYAGNKENKTNIKKDMIINNKNNINSFYKNFKKENGYKNLGKNFDEECSISNAIRIEDEKIKLNRQLYNNIKTRLTNLASRSKLPFFNIDDFLIWQKIGNGSNGEIFEISSNKTNKKYAVKIINEKSITSLEYIIKEFEIVYQNKHKNIIDLYGISIRCIHKDLYILYVLMDLGLQDWDEEISQREKKNKFYTERELVVILKQLISVLLYLQKEKSISHRDIKLENILLFENNNFKLIDFGEAKQRVERNVRKTLRGTDFYMSPLLYNGLVQNKNYVQHNPYKSDVFSLGLCFIIAASLNFKIVNEIRKSGNDEQVRQVLINNFNGRYSDDFTYLLMKMITIEEKNRPDFVDLSRIVQNYYYDIE